MIELAKKLQPIYRSILGPGIRASMDIIREIHPEFKNLKFRSGKKIFDWVIPDEWIIKDAYIQSTDGKRYAEFNKCNLHVMGYSECINKIVTKDELMNHIHSLPELPHAVPYTTSYYKRDWGFCIERDQIKELTDEKYKVVIESKFVKGKLNIIEAIIPGKSRSEILFTSYLCHPYMANNELSGPVVLSEIMSFVKSIKNRHYSYRFVIFPETIGSLAYLSKRLNILKRNVVAGFHLTCVGDEKEYSIIHTRKKDKLVDKLIKAHAAEIKEFKYYEYLERRSDERQFGVANIDLPICTFSRSKPGSFDEYHTNLDNFDLVTSEGLKGSFRFMRDIIKSLEIGLYPKSLSYGEPMMSKYNLYPEKSTREICKSKKVARELLDIIAYSDGDTSILEMHEIMNQSMKNIREGLQVLYSHNLVRKNHIASKY